MGFLEVFIQRNWAFDFLFQFFFIQVLLLSRNLGEKFYHLRDFQWGAKRKKRVVLNFIHAVDHPLEASDDDQTFFVRDLAADASVVAGLASLVSLKDGHGFLDLEWNK